MAMVGGHETSLVWTRLGSGWGGNFGATGWKRAATHNPKITATAAAPKGTAARQLHRVALSGPERTLQVDTGCAERTRAATRWWKDSPGTVPERGCSVANFEVTLVISSG